MCIRDSLYVYSYVQINEICKKQHSFRKILTEMFSFSEVVSKNVILFSYFEIKVFAHCVQTCFFFTESSKWIRLWHRRLAACLKHFPQLSHKNASLFFCPLSSSVFWNQCNAIINELAMKDYPTWAVLTTWATTIH